MPKLCEDIYSDVLLNSIITIITRYTMLGGEAPYEISEGDSDEVVLKKLSESDLCLSGGNWNHISASAKDLIQQMLSLDVKQRPSAEQGFFLS